MKNIRPLVTFAILVSAKLLAAEKGAREEAAAVTKMEVIIEPDEKLETESYMATTSAPLDSKDGSIETVVVEGKSTENDAQVVKRSSEEKTAKDGEKQESDKSEHESKVVEKRTDKEQENIDVSLTEEKSTKSTDDAVEDKSGVESSKNVDVVLEDVLANDDEKSMDGKFLKTNAPNDDTPTSIDDKSYDVDSEYMTSKNTEYSSNETSEIQEAVSRSVEIQTPLPSSGADQRQGDVSELPTDLNKSTSSRRAHSAVIEMKGRAGDENDDEIVSRMGFRGSGRVAKIGGRKSHRSDIIPQLQALNRGFHHNHKMLPNPDVQSRRADIIPYHNVHQDPFNPLLSRNVYNPLIDQFSNAYPFAPGADLVPNKQLPYNIYAKLAEASEYPRNLANLPLYKPYDHTFGSQIDPYSYLRSRRYTKPVE